MNQKKFVNEVLSNLLKIKGFDEPCFATWQNSKIVFASLHHPSNSLQTFITTAPLLSDIVDWLREKHYVEVIVKTIYTVNEIIGYQGYINLMMSYPVQKLIALGEVEGTLDYWETLELSIEKAITLL